MSDPVKMIDPPNGHAFGLPKQFPYADDEEPAGDALDAWLLANGYPKD